MQSYFNKNGSSDDLIFITVLYKDNSLAVADMALLKNHLKKEIQNFIFQGVRFKMIGNREMVPSDILEVIEETESATTYCKSLITQFAISYSGRDEIIRAVKKAMDGKVNLRNLQIAGLTVDVLLQEANKQGIQDLRQVFFAQYTTEGKVDFILDERG